MRQSSWPLLLGTMLGAFMAIAGINATSAAVGLVQSQFAVTPQQLSLLVSVYVLAEIISMPLLPLLNKRWGHQTISVLAIAGFILASAICGLAGSYEVLLLGRLLQGACGGLLIPLVHLTIRAELQLAQHWLGMGLFSLFAGIAPLVGPLYTGLLGESQLSWLFWVNIPLGLLALVMIQSHAISPRAHQSPPIHLAGLLPFVLLILGLTGCVFLLEFGAEYGWWHSGFVRVLSAASLLLLALGLLSSLQTDTPWINFRVMREPGCALVMSASFIVGVVVYALIYVIPLYLVLLHQYSPQQIVTVVLMTAIPQLLFAPWLVSFHQKFNPFLLFFIGAMLAALSCLLLIQLTPWHEAGAFWSSQLLRAFAIPLLVIPLGVLSLRLGKAEDASDIAMLFNLLRTLGGAVGISAMVAMLQHFEAVSLMQNWAHWPKRVQPSSVSHYLEQHHGLIEAKVAMASYQSFSWLFLIISFMLMATGLVALLKRQ